MRLGPLSPCGYVMDLVRSTYRTLAQLGDGQDSRVILDWHRADPGAPTFPIPHLYGSLNWVGNEPVVGDVGEVVGAPRLWTEGAPFGWPLPDHFCGTEEQWEEGIGEEEPEEIEVDPETGRPVCCEGPGPPVVTPCAPTYAIPRVYHGVITAAGDPALVGRTMEMVYDDGLGTWEGDADVKIVGDGVPNVHHSWGCRAVGGGMHLFRGIDSGCQANVGDYGPGPSFPVPFSMTTGWLYSTSCTGGLFTMAVIWSFS